MCIAIGYLLLTLGSLDAARLRPGVRRQALELLAEQPSQDLAPVTYALVDEDDSVRARAQELYQQLAREAATTHPLIPGDAADAMGSHAE